MINALLRGFVRSCLWLRYRIRTEGLEDVAVKGRRGILFLPNHPALIDPIILMALLQGRFAPRALADRDQIDRFFIRWLARRSNVRPIPDLAKYGLGARGELREALADCGQVLKEGGNLLVYPSGRAYRSRLEDVGGNSAVQTLLEMAPQARVVLVRMTGLWGSRFSWARGVVPDVGGTVKKGLGVLLLNGLLFCPRREVRIEFREPDDFPRAAGRAAVNRYLEGFYNKDAPFNTYVPYTIWEGGGPRRLPEPPGGRMAGRIEAVPDETRRLVGDYLRKLTGARTLREEQSLTRDLGLDSLARADLVLWLQGEFGFAVQNVDALQTVGDAILAAAGESVSAAVDLKPVPHKWFKGERQEDRLPPPRGETVVEAFLAQVRRWPDRAIIADQAGGVRTYRDLAVAGLILKAELQRIPQERVGIMLPACVAADVAYLSVLLAGKTPVMINWTMGPRHMTHALELTGVRTILTGKALVGRLQSQGIDLAGMQDRFSFLEDIAGRLTRWRKLRAWARSRIDPGALAGVRVPDTAVILFTSGSESLPKAVPLSHRNLLANLHDAFSVLTLKGGDRLMSFLPPFHSFGLTVGMLAPLCGGLATVYHPDPTDGATIARVIHAYRATLLVGTPTFLNGVVRVASPEQLASLRLAVTGAEKCPERVYTALAERCPRMVVMEGYGMTECSPIVSVSDGADPRSSTIGKVLPSFEHAIVDVDTHRPTPPGTPGMLLVRGPSVFAGYLNYPGPAPFVEVQGKTWYQTGDLVSEDSQGVLRFHGRLKRFVKLGGEMISLPAVEAVLESAYAKDTDEGPVVAVEGTPEEEHPELVLFTTREIDREEANRRIRDAGLSSLHNIRRVVRLKQMPVLGTGKTDYRALRAMVSGG